MSQTTFQRKDARAPRRKGSIADFRVCLLARAQTCRLRGAGGLADWGIGDTTRLETCATIVALCALAPLRLCAKPEVPR